MPVLELNDLGKDEDSSAKEIINKVLVALNKALLPLISENVGLGDQLKDVGEKISEKLKGFFKFRICTYRKSVSHWEKRLVLNVKMLFFF